MRRCPKRIFGALLLLFSGTIIVGDLFFHEAIDRGLRKILLRNNDALAARVGGHPITNKQLDRATRERLWLDGKSEKTASDEERKAARSAALVDLIDHELLRQKVSSPDPEITVSGKEIDARVQQISSRFDDASKFEDALLAEGLGNVSQLRERFAAMIRQEKWLAAQTAGAVKVSDAEAKEWYDQHPEATGIPERVEARQVFIATLEHPPDEAKQKLEAALADLTEKRKDFATLAKELSEDEANKKSGGSLGWMTRERMPADFATPLFLMEPNKPELIRSKLGWHLVEVTARKPAEPRTFDQAKPEIVAALETINRAKAVKALRKSLLIKAASTGEVEFVTD